MYIKRLMMIKLPSRGVSYRCTTGSGANWLNFLSHSCVVKIMSAHPLLANGGIVCQVLSYHHQ